MQAHDQFVLGVAVSMIVLHALVEKLDLFELTRCILEQRRSDCAMGVQYDYY